MLTFFKGFMTALVLTAIAAGLVVGYLTQSGLTLAIRSDDVAQKVQSQVFSQATQELPALIAGIKTQVPEQVAKDLSKQLADAQLSFYGVTMPIPDAAVAQLRAKLQETIAADFNKSLDAVDVEAAAKKWSATSQDMIRQVLAKEWGNRTLQLQILPGIVVPVSVVIR